MATYYVKNAATDDTGDGLTPATAWKTIAKVNASSFNAGDSILFNRGDIWREQLMVPSSGTSVAPITFSRYGTGANPILIGADIKTGWAVDGTNWSVACVTEPKVLFVNDVWATKGASVVALTDGQWFWAANLLTVRRDAGNPDGAVTVQIGQRDNTVVAYHRAYITLQGLTLKYANDNSISVTGTAGNHNGWRVDAVDITGAGAAGLCFANTQDDLVLTHVTVTGVNGIGLYYQGGARATITDCSFTGGKGTPYSSDGVRTINASTNMTFTRVLCENNTDCGFRFQNASAFISLTDCVANANGEDGFQLFTGHAVHDVTCVRCIGSRNGTTMSGDNWGNGDGFTSHASNYNFYLYNCLAYLNTNTGFAMVDTSSGRLYDCVAYGNGITTGGYTPVRGGMYLPVTGVDVNGATWTVKNCISANNAPHQLNLSAWGATNVVMDYNNYFDGGHTAAENTFGTVTADPANLVSWNTYHASHEPHSLYADPLFTNAAGGDFTLQPTSPCIDAGVVITGITDGFSGLAPDIGTNEYIEPSTPALSDIVINTLKLTPIHCVIKVSGAAGTVTINLNDLLCGIHEVALNPVVDIMGIHWAIGGSAPATIKRNNITIWTGLGSFGETYNGFADIQEHTSDIVITFGSGGGTIVLELLKVSGYNNTQHRNFNQDG